MEEEYKYREVNRQAKVGERILITDSWESYGQYKDGDEFIVEDADAEFGGVYVSSVSKGDGFNDDGLIADSEYVVLEPVGEQGTFQTDRDLIVELAYTVSKMSDRLNFLNDRLDTLDTELSDANQLVDSLHYIQQGILHDITAEDNPKGRQ